VKVAEKKGVPFIMTTVIGGLLFLVPVVFLVIILGKAVGFMMVIAEPMADFLPVDTVGGVALALGTAERIGFEVQELPDGRSMVYIPSAPNTWSGVTQILPADQITYLDTPMMSVMELTERYGFGVEALLATKQTDHAPD